jgi:hypothetical protein
MIDRRLQWRRAKAIQALCQTGRSAEIQQLQRVVRATKTTRDSKNAFKICETLNRCAPHNK